VNEFVQHLREHRGNPDSTIHKKTQHVQRFIAFLRVRRRRPQQSRLQDIDEFLIQCRRRYARATVADIGCTLRSFMRFLVATGRISADLAPSITTPIIRRLERPHRTLPWEDVQRILRAVDRSTPCGRRDYVLLLMMSTYGMGAGEVIRLTLDDVDWQSATVHVARPKTGVEFLLPLLPAVARALVSYLRKGRPHHADSPSVRDHARATPAVGLFGHHPTHPPHACAARGRFGTIPRHTRVSSHACVPANGVGDSNEGDWRHPGTS
jgi:integrase